jgi:hypothetical protein
MCEPLFWWSVMEQNSRKYLRFLNGQHASDKTSDVCNRNQTLLEFHRKTSALTFLFNKPMNGFWKSVRFLSTFWHWCTWRNIDETCDHSCEEKVEIFISLERKIMFNLYLVKLAIRRFTKERVRLVVTAILTLVKCDIKILSGNLVKLTKILHGFCQCCKPVLKLYYTDFYF